jgi:hypothetical protein
MIMLQYDADLITDLMRMDERRRLGTFVPRTHHSARDSSGILLYCVVHVILQIPTKYDGYKSTTDTVVAINKRESCKALVMSWVVDGIS